MPQKTDKIQKHPTESPFQQFLTETTGYTQAQRQHAQEQSAKQAGKAVAPVAIAIQQQAPKVIAAGGSAVAGLGTAVAGIGKGVGSLAQAPGKLADSVSQNMPLVLVAVVAGAYLFLTKR